MLVRGHSRLSALQQDIYHVDYRDHRHLQREQGEAAYTITSGKKSSPQLHEVGLYMYITLDRSLPVYEGL